nr:reverse transcriptase domain-containing protein [Tanacetum cinerariifolium]
MRVPNVPSSLIKLMLFPFSLEGATRIWHEKEPPRSIQTWDDLVSKFINQFFPHSKTTNLRNEITRFQQRFDESFYEAWERFNDLLRACPHHGYSELHQLDTFYNALNINNQDSLNSAAGGNFLDKMPRECLKIIESKSKVRQSRAKAVVAKVGFDQTQPLQSLVIHQPPQETSIKILHDQEHAINSVQTFLRKFNRISFFEMPKVLLLAWDRVFKIKDALGNKQYKSEDIQELLRELFNNVQNIHEELAEYINTPGWNRPAFCNNGDDDDEDCTIAVTPDFSITDSLIMGNEHLDTILETKLDEFIKSSVENLVSILRESEDFFEDECECDVLDCDDSQTTNFSTFYNPLFKDSTSSDDESSHEEVIHKMSFKTYSSPLFDLDEEIISRDNLFLERLLHDDPIPFPDTLDFSYDHSRKCEDSCQMILSSKSLFPQLQLGINLLHLAGSQPMLKSSYKAEDGVIISIPSLVGGVADVVVEIKGTGWSISITFRFSVRLQTPDDLSRSRLGFIKKWAYMDDLPFES